MQVLPREYFVDLLTFKARQNNVCPVFVLFFIIYIYFIKLRGTCSYFSGTKFGQGVYFAKDAKYSVSYTGSGGGARYMYLARVLVGKYCAGKPDMKVPPPKDSARPEVLYDSVVDQISDPSIFVVFYDNQCYPEYLINF